MAKSLRSKWKRKMRAVKRDRYAAKELKQLKQMLDQAEQSDVNMSDICTVVTKETLSEDKTRSSTADTGDATSCKTNSRDFKKRATHPIIHYVLNEDDVQPNSEASNVLPLLCRGPEYTFGKMEIDKPVSKYHPKRLTNEHGNYPIWMNQRAIKKHKAKQGILKKSKGKKNKRK